MRILMTAAVTVFFGALVWSVGCGSDSDAGGGGTDGGGSGGSAGTGGGDSGVPEAAAEASDEASADAGDKYEQFAAVVEADRVADNKHGMAIAILENGQLTFSKGFGYKGVIANGSEAVQDTTLFMAGMFGQTLTTLGMLRLADAGEVDLDAPVTTYVPEFTVNQGSEHVAALDVRHLLENTSGLPVDPSPPAGWSGADDTLLDQYVTSTDFATDESLLFPPGRLPYWSNRAPVISGLIEERISGQPYEVFLHDEVLQPLGMTRTIFHSAEILADGDYARGTWGNPTTSVPDITLIHPDGNFFTNVLDLAKLTRFLLNGDETFLNDATRQSMLAAKTQDYSYMDAVHWGLGSFNVQSGLFGADQRYYAYPFDTVTLYGIWYSYAEYLCIIPSKGFAMIALTHDTGWDVNKALQHAFSILLDLPPVAPSTETEDPSKLDKYVGEYEAIGQGTIEVTSTANGLHMQWAGNHACDLVAGYPLNFTCAGAGLSYTGVSFVPDSQGGIEYIRTPNWVAHRLVVTDAGAGDASDAD